MGKVLKKNIFRNVKDKTIQLRVLLADNDSNFGYVLKKELEEQCFTVDVVTSGFDAIISFIKKEYEFILLEVYLPKLTGLNTLRILNALKTFGRINEHVKIITFSCENGKKKDEMLNSGSDKYFKKPFNIDSLVSYMRCSQSSDIML